MKTLYVIDFMNLAFRNYHAFAKHNLTTKDGEATGTLYGMTSFMVNLIKDKNPDYIAVAMESDTSFRKDMYHKYKENREGRPSDFEEQLGSVIDMFNLLNIPMVRIDGLEADDVIGCIVKQYSKDKNYIVSGDKDFMQLINDNTKLLIPKNGGKYIEASYKEVEEKFGCRPEQVVDVLAIMGDKVDCIPGVNGIGEKGASKLIKNFGSLESIYENINSSDITRSHRDKLLKFSDDAFISQRLAKIVTDVVIPIPESSLEFNPNTLKSQEFLAFLDRYEMKSIRSKILVNLNGLD